jgi:hypothetical protein
MSKGAAIGYIVGAMLAIIICLVAYYWHKENED